MPFGIDDIFYILAAAQTANSLANPPENPTNTAGAQAAGGALPASAQGGPFQLPTTGAMENAQTMPAMDPKQPIDTKLIDQLAQQAAAKGKPPPAQATPLTPAAPLPQLGQTPEPFVPPTVQAGAPPPQQTVPQDRAGIAAPQAPMSVGEVLAATPAALANISNLLGMNQPEKDERAAPIPGGTMGQVVPSFNLPQNVNLGDILARIQGMR